MAITNPPHWKEHYKNKGPKYDKIVEIIAEMNSPTIDHATRHQNGGTDEILVAGLSGLLADNQNPVSHAASHQSGGGDPLLHASAHEPTGGDAMTVDAVAATGSLRTLGTGSQQAAPGDYIPWPQYIWKIGNPWLFSNTVQVGSFGATMPGYLSLPGSGSWNTVYFYGLCYVEVPVGYKIRAVKLIAEAYQDTNLYWGELRLYEDYWTSTLVSNVILGTIFSPFTTATGIRQYISGDFTGTWLYGYDDDPALNLRGFTLRLRVTDSASSGTLNLYGWRIKLEYSKI